MNRRKFLKAGLLWVPCAPAIVRAQSIGLSLLQTSPPTGGGGGSNFMVETFEDATVGFVSNNTYGWSTSGGGFNAKYTTSPAPLADTQSGAANLGDYASTTFTGVSELFVYSLFELSAGTTDSPRIFDFRISTGFPGAILVTMDGGNSLRASIQTTSGSAVLTTSAMAAATKYNCWAHYKAGSGANAIADFEFQPFGTGRVGSGNNFVQITNGNATGNVDHVYLVHTASNGHVQIWDNLKLSTTGYPSP